MIDKIIERIKRKGQELMNTKPPHADEYGLYSKGIQAMTLQAIDIVKQVAEEGGWIKCSDRLPNEYGYYLTTRLIGYKSKPSRFMEILYWDGNNKWTEGVIQNENIDNVIAWQRLPKPFKESD